MEIQWHQRWCLSLEKWGWGEFLLCPVSKCRTGDNVSTVGINLPQLRAEIKAIRESGTTWHQELSLASLNSAALRTQRRRYNRSTTGHNVILQRGLPECNEGYLTVCCPTRMLLGIDMQCLFPVCQHKFGISTVWGLFEIQRVIMFCSYKFRTSSWVIRSVKLVHF